MTYQAPPITRNARVDASSNPGSSRRLRSSAAAATITTTTSPMPAPPLISAANPSNDQNDQRAPRDIGPEREAATSSRQPVTTSASSMSQRPLRAAPKTIGVVASMSPPSAAGPRPIVGARPAPGTAPPAAGAQRGGGR